MKRTTLLLSTLAFLTLGLRPARAAIVVIAPTPTTAGSLVITQDIVIPVTVSGPAQLLVFDNWVPTSDGGAHTSALGASVQYTINGGSSQTATNATLTDNAVTPLFDVTASDGYFTFPTFFAVTIGNVVTFTAGTYPLAATSFFNPQATQTFTGNVFLANNFAARLSNNIAVPEPNTAALCGLGLLLGGAVRRHRRAGGGRS